MPENDRIKADIMGTMRSREEIRDDIMAVANALHDMVEAPGRDILPSELLSRYTLDVEWDDADMAARFSFHPSQAYRIASEDLGKRLSQIEESALQIKADEFMDARGLKRQPVSGLLESALSGEFMDFVAQRAEDDPVCTVIVTHDGRAGVDACRITIDTGSCEEGESFVRRPEDFEPEKVDIYAHIAPLHK